MTCFTELFCFSCRESLRSRKVLGIPQILQGELFCLICSVLFSCVGLFDSVFWVILPSVTACLCMEKVCVVKF